jgi:hypothetical protein
MRDENVVLRHSSSTFKSIHVGLTASERLAPIVGIEIGPRALLLLLLRGLALLHLGAILHQLSAEQRGRSKHERD